MLPGSSSFTVLELAVEVSTGVLKLRLTDVNRETSVAALAGSTLVTMGPPHADRPVATSTKRTAAAAPFMRRAAPVELCVTSCSASPQPMFLGAFSPRKLPPSEPPEHIRRG